MVEPPFSSIYDLSNLSDAGAEIAIQPSPEQRSRIAEWAGLDGVESFAAAVTLRRSSANRFAYEAELNADIVQTCVVTLEPVRSHMALNISRALHLTKFLVRAKFAEHELAPATDEAPEEIQDSHYDLAGPLLEEFTLAIDPYPRCPGVAFEVPDDEDGRESPFAVLKTLKGPN